jgi:cytochrome c oxidase assembly protein subunit 15
MASILTTIPRLRSAAPRLSRRLFVCRPCPSAPHRSAVAVAAARSSAPRPSISQSVRWSSTQPLRSSATLSASPAHAAALAGAAKGQARSSSFPKTSSKSVAYWLLGSAASVFGIVIFGGLTRLTESG